jgi:hypothetical protein
MSIDLAVHDPARAFWTCIGPGPNARVQEINRRKRGVLRAGYRIRGPGRASGSQGLQFPCFSSDFDIQAASNESELRKHGVELLRRGPLSLPAPPDLVIPTVFDAPYTVFDTLFYWED